MSDLLRRPIPRALLRYLSAGDERPLHHFAAGTISALRRRGLIERIVRRDADGRQSTVYRITDAGRAVIS